MVLLNLRVKPGIVSGIGQELLAAANAIPAIPRPVSPAGADPLSMAIAAHVTCTVTLLVADRPVVKEESTTYARALGTAARAYVGTDEPLGGKIDRQLCGFPTAG
ncbi:hypothetical protein MSP7336_02593 [Mycobacterium shimoidei]|uniref:PE domain-containing protein n=1 Tax=Mycobacterium shimoidei TaxID=29313 RepID=A0A375YZM3_MYCSH|nr:PE domain-containing protein [Mycobacterium shimoidei]SRX94339.1 hypothetical protein MSP7336_02593 [Mycobacterium shimoidei]